MVEVLEGVVLHSAELLFADVGPETIGRARAEAGVQQPADEGEDCADSHLYAFHEDIVHVAVGNADIYEVGHKHGYDQLEKVSTSTRNMPSSIYRLYSRRQEKMRLSSGIRADLLRAKVPVRAAEEGGEQFPFLVGKAAEQPLVEARAAFRPGEGGLPALFSQLDYTAAACAVNPLRGL